ncbi:MAG: JAB domain-containing protein [Aureispira sp.]
MTINLSKADKIKLLNSESIYSIMQKILLREDDIEQNKEHFWILGLANNNRLLFVELISLGSVNKTIVEPMEVYSMALQKRAVKIILCHNHPSGELKPSKEDLDITDRLIQVGRIVNLPVLDHLIISDISYLSFDDIGLMQELQASIKYVPSYELAQRIREEMEELMETRVAEAKELATRIAKEQEKLTIATALKNSGMQIEDIARFTGLSVDEIKSI